MSHNIEIRNGRAMTFSVGEVPWHGLGKVLENPLTAKEAIKEAGLDWEVVLEPLITKNTRREVTFKKAVVRTDYNEVLGVVGNIYTPIQNSEAFDFFDSVVGEGQAIYHTAGSLQNGKRIWILAKLTGSPITVTKSDVVEKYLLLTNSHDGSSALRMFFTPVRVVCNNTLNVALQKGVREGISIRHSTNIKQKVQEARRVLGISLKYYEVFQDQVKLLSKKSITQSILNDYLRELFPTNKEAFDDTRVLNMRAEVEEVFNSPRNTLPGIRGTAWAMFNAVAEYADHWKTFRGGSADNRLRSIWFGSSARLKQKAFEKALEIAKV